MGEFSLPKTSLLRKSDEFKRVYREGKRLKGNNFGLIIASNNEQGNRLGISVHGVKKAVRRNRIKRIIREYFRLSRGMVNLAETESVAAESYFDIVFTVRKDFSPDSPQEVAAVIDQLLEKAKNRPQRDDD